MREGMWRWGSVGRQGRSFQTYFGEFRFPDPSTLGGFTCDGNFIAVVAPGAMAVMTSSNTTLLNGKGFSP
ncbi:hypothetical protein Agabi119p4_378 [Agaricus bisporus var. burnettii]|uniref:Uncharacterized protein n=1 Tax=Agaricus bisporus var. burnettii TaxID=192524 RepID=A0A8H7FAH8_AGABI|nr:hypothetical protein Agabi119p4_378 [Agaricus bisporus var. burnettii]